MDIDELFKCKDLTKASLDSYKAKLKKLNENKPIKNLNFLSDIEKINNIIDKYKPNTKRNYIIAVASILKCSLHHNKTKKIETLYNQYSKILEDYNINLKDQTAMTETENKNWLEKDELDQVYNDLKEKYKSDKQAFQNYVLLSLYYLQAPRRNRDFQLLKIATKYNDTLSNEFNYFDIKKKKFIFNNYKTKNKYNKQEVEVNEELFQILMLYIKAFKLKDGDHLLNDLKTNQPYKATNSITLLLNRIFKKKVGASMLRKSYLTHKYGNNSEELKKDMTAMGSSVDVAMNNYIKKS
jgi:integrase